MTSTTPLVRAHPGPPVAPGRPPLRERLAYRVAARDPQSPCESMLLRNAGGCAHHLTLHPHASAWLRTLAMQMLLTSSVVEHPNEQPQNNSEQHGKAEQDRTEDQDAD